MNNNELKVFVNALIHSKLLRMIPRWGEYTYDKSLKWHIDEFYPDIKYDCLEISSLIDCASQDQVSQLYLMLDEDQRNKRLKNFSLLSLQEFENNVLISLDKVLENYITSAIKYEELHLMKSPYIIKIIFYKRQVANDMLLLKVKTESQKIINKQIKDFKEEKEKNAEEERLRKLKEKKERESALDNFKESFNALKEFLSDNELDSIVKEILF